MVGRDKGQSNSKSEQNLDVVENSAESRAFEVKRNFSESCKFFTYLY